MERRFTALLLPALLVALVWWMLPPSNSARPAAPGQQVGGFSRVGPTEAQGDVFTHDFGTPGQAGYRVKFDRRGGAVREVRLLDHYVSIEARDKATHVDGDYYDIVQASPHGVLMLVLEDDPRARRFPRVRIDEVPEAASEGGAPDYARWMPKVSTDEVRLTLDCQDGRTLEKVFRYTPGRRDLEVEIVLRSTRADEPEAGTNYPLTLRGVMLPNPRSEHVIGGNPAFAIAGWHDAERNAPAHVLKHPTSPRRIEALGVPPQAPATFAGATNRFFGAFLLPSESLTVSSVLVESQPDPPDAGADLLPHSVPALSYGVQLPVPKANESASVRFRLYLGPKSFGMFESQPEYAALDAVMQEDLNPPGCFNVCAIPGVTWMATNLLRLLEYLHGIVGNWGVAIILLTVLVKIAVFFLNFRSQKAMRAFGAKMARVKPELDAIQTRYKDDQKRLQQEMMLLYRKHKMFPPLGGCLPMFLTIPVFFGLFTALRVSYDLRHQPFALWIKDLSAPDALFHTGLSLVPHFNVLPLVWMVLYSIMMFRMKLPTDPQQRTMQQMMRWMFLLFGVLLYNYASGLLLYMCTSMALAFFEQWLIKKILGPMPEMPGMTSMPQF